MEYSISGPTTFVQHAGVAALRSGEPFIAQSRARYAKGRKVVSRRILVTGRFRLT